MPYIDQTRRAELNPVLNPLLISGVEDWSVGDLNYVLTNIINMWLSTSPSYTRYTSAVGVLTSAQLELYRRRVAPYEDVKRLENGEVYW